MPRQSSVTGTRLVNLIACLDPAVTLLKELHDAVGTLFCPQIANTTVSLITVLPNVKRNKAECIELVERLHELIYAIINLHINSETPGILPPATLHHVTNFSETLFKIHSFVEMQQEGNKIKQLFRQSEMNTLLKDCRAGLKNAFELFEISTHGLNWNNIVETRKKAEQMHHEMLEFISSLSDGVGSEESFMEQVVPELKNRQELMFRPILVLTAAYQHQFTFSPAIKAKDILWS
ncbi:hypothetical protein MVEN_00861600 [Mycena venus]|uniref:Uncharacterized protein n=1 Tax=Mycena venus TaxID=2733690 RepID=A0A8H7D1K4_9AGAR|nr:hypothetical protein MVEN_00861600 [Mycena venus]